MAVAFDSEPVWFRPRDEKGDKLCYYLRDGRQGQHVDISPLTPHPFASINPRYTGLVFLYREPVGDDGWLVRDWYGPSELVDDLLSINTAGGGLTSALLYPRGSEPPTNDDRITLEGELVDEDISFSPGWVAHPITLASGINAMELQVDGLETLTGNEVYLNITDLGNLGEIDGVEVGIFKILRHIDSQTIHIEIPYDANVVPTGPVIADTHEACYILDGYADTESAPGVLADKFHVRSFTYRLATPSYSYPWDDTLGLELTQETRAVPREWSRNWDVGFTPAAYSDEENSVSYQAGSKLVYTRQKNGINGSPSEDGVIWGGRVRLRVPAILKSFSLPFVWARAVRNGYLSYDEDWGLSQEVWGPGEISCTTRTIRRIVKTANIAATITAMTNNTYSGGSLSLPIGGDLFSFLPKGYNLNIGSWMAYSGDNVWTRTRVRALSLGPFLLSNGSVSSVLPLPTYTIGPPATGINVEVQGSTVTFTDSDPPPWGTEVLYDIRESKARWGYWIMDFTYITLPADPSV